MKEMLAYLVAIESKCFVQLNMQNYNESQNLSLIAIDIIHKLQMGIQDIVEEFTL